MNNYILTYELNKLLVKIEEKTNNYLFNNRTVIETLLSYCRREGFAKRYDCLFWDNEGYNWEFNQNCDVVSLIDEFFLKYKDKYHPGIPNISYSKDGLYKTRLNYIYRK